MKQEIWIWLAAPSYVGRLKIDRRLEQLTELLDRLLLELIEIRQVLVKRPRDD